jgi:tryptophan halogenase
MSGARIREILVVGGSLAGWMSAAILARSLPRRLYQVRVVEPASVEADLETIGAIATLPLIRGAHDALGASERALVREARATFSLGAEFSGWPRKGRHYFRPFAAFGAPLDGIAFHNLWQRMRRAGGAGELEDYSLAATAARLGRFALPASDPGSVLSTLDYGYHLDGEAYRLLLRALAQQSGAIRIEGEVAGAELRGSDGAIETVTLTDGRRIAADFYFDCTGARATLVGEALGIRFESWSKWLRCDRAIATRIAGGEAAPFMRADAAAAGWQWTIPVRDGTDIGLVYANDHVVDEPAGAALSGKGGTTKATRFASGRRAAFWSRNCIAIGAAGCVIDPLEPSALQIVQRGVSEFLQLMPYKDEDGGEADEYNRLMTETVERMRDLVILHYKLNARDDSPFWPACAAMPLPDILADKLRLFASQARVLELDEELFPDSAWIATYFGQGVAPRNYHALADALDKAEVRDRLASMRKVMRTAAETMPSQQGLLDKLGAR